MRGSTKLCLYVALTIAATVGAPAQAALPLATKSGGFTFGSVDGGLAYICPIDEGWALSCTADSALVGIPSPHSSGTVAASAIMGDHGATAPRVLAHVDTSAGALAAGYADLIYYLEVVPDAEVAVPPFTGFVRMLGDITIAEGGNAFVTVSAHGETVFFDTDPGLFDRALLLSTLTEYRVSMHAEAVSDSFGSAETTIDPEFILSAADTPYYHINYSSNLVATLPIPGVPEPATWAMMILGFGMIGSAARRRAARHQVN